MMAWSELLHEPFVVRWGWALLHFVWQGLLLGLLAGATLQLLRRHEARTRYAVSMLFLTACAVFPLATYLWLGPIDQSTSAVARPISSGDVVIRQKQDESPELALVDPATSKVSESNLATQATTFDTALAPPASETTRWRFQLDGTTLQPHLPWLVAAWMFGVALFSLRLAGGWWMTRRLFSRGVVPLRSDWQSKLDVLATKLNITTSVRWLESATAAVPVTIGFLRPVVVVPTAILLGLSPSQVECLLAHELIHIRRWDYLAVWWQSVIEVLLFYHPTVWWLSRRIRQERELICDDLVVNLTGDRLTYSRALLSVAESATRQPALVLSADGGELKGRIARILGQQARGGSLLSWILPLVLLSMAGVTAAYYWAGDEQVATNEEVATDDLAAANVPIVEAADSEVEILADGKISLDPIAGRVVNSEREPIRGARVFLRQQPQGMTGSTNRPARARDLALTASDSLGRFRFTGVRVDDPTRALDVVVVADGFAISWKHLLNTETPENLNIRLEQPTTVAGRVVNERGEPLSGAKVRVQYLMSTRHIAQSDLEEGRWPRNDDAKYLVIEDSASAPFVQADADGRFEMSALPEGIGAVLQVQHPDHALAEVYTATVGQLDAENAAHAKRNVQAGLVNAELKRSRTVKVQVVYGDTGEPAAGARHPNVLHGIVHAPMEEADESGRLEINHIDDRRYKLIVYAPKNSDYLGCFQQVEFQEQEFEKSIVFKLQRGAIVSGRVVNSKTNQGVANVSVSVGTPVLLQSGIVAVVERMGQADEGKSLVETPIMSDSNGAFRAVVRPGTVGVTVQSRVPGYRTIGHNGRVLPQQTDARRTVTASLEQPVDDVTLKLEPGSVVRGTIYGPDGQPVPGALIFGRARGSQNSFSHTHYQADEQGGFVLDDLFSLTSADTPPRNIEIEFIDRSKKLGAIVSIPNEVPSTPEQVRDVHLYPLGVVTGQILNSDTQVPVEGVTIGLNKQSGDFYYSTFQRTRTSKDGRFELVGVFNEVEHYLTVSDRRFLDHNSYTTRFMGNVARPHDAGIVKLTPKEPLPEANLAIYEAPKLAGLSNEDAFAMLVSQYQSAFAEYGARLEGAGSQDERDRIVMRREPAPAIAERFKELAESSHDAEFRWKCLQWILDCRTISGSDKRLRVVKQWAAQEVLAKHIKRPELAQHVLALSAYGGETSAAVLSRLLTENPNRDVQGRACYELARETVSNTYRGPTPEAKQKAIGLLDRVIKEFADVPYRRGTTLGKAAEKDLFELKHLDVGEAAPEITGKDLDGTDMSLSQFRGKVVVLNFWGSWCGPCISELPDLKRIAAEFADQAVVLGVMTDSIENARKVVAEHEVTYPNWLDGGRTGAIINQWNIQSWPTTYIIDQQGVIRYKQAQPSEFRDAVWKLVHEDKTVSPERSTVQPQRFLPDGSTQSNK